MEFKEAIQKIKNEFNIVDFVKTNGTDLQNSGNGTYKGLCPFHNEKTPSFTVSEDFQNYRCFGCGASGDVLSFAQHTHTVSFYEAVKMLAEEKGIELDTIESDEPANDINGIRRVLEDAHKFFRYNYTNLSDNHPAKQEIVKRGLDVNNELYGFSLEAPNDLYKFLSAKGHSDENIDKSTLVMFNDDGREPWDFFHGRLMITLSDYLGRPVSFTSRKIYEDDRMKGKYVNGKESPIFHKKSNLFGANLAKREARTSKTIYIVEGQFDQISMFENGIENVVATSGTAFTDEHANLLLRMVGDNGKIIFIMDGDDAGIEAAIKVFTSSKTLHSNAYAVLLEDGKDPCDYIEDGGIDNLKSAIDTAVPLHDFVVDATLKSLGGSITVNNRQRFVSEVAMYAKYADDKYIIDSMLGKASVLSAISIDNVKDVYKKADGKKVYTKREEEQPEKVELSPLLKLDMTDEADRLMFSALALLVRIPNELIPETPEKIHKKFRPFLKEVGARYKELSGGWRFIAEDYNDSDFATLLQNKEYLENPKDDIDSSVSQYKYLFNRANELYTEQYNSMRKAQALSSIIDSTDAEEVSRVLNIYKKSQ